MLANNLAQAVRTQLVDDLLADSLQAVRFLRVYNKVVSVIFSNQTCWNNLATSLIISTSLLTFVNVRNSTQSVL